MAASPPPGPPKPTPDWRRYSALGLEMALAVGLCAYGGHRLDEAMGWQPWGLLTGCLLGTATSVLLVLKQTASLFRD